MRLPVICILAGVMSCSAVTEPEADTTFELGGSRLRLAVSSSSAVVYAGEPDTLRIVLTNQGPHPVTIHFNDTCQLLPYIRHESGQLVVPSYGEWGCGHALTQIDLAAGHSETRNFVWSGGTQLERAHGQPLPPGTYLFSAAMPARDKRVTTPPIAIELRPARRLPG